MPLASRRWGERGERKLSSSGLVERGAERSHNPLTCGGHIVHRTSGGVSHRRTPARRSFAMRMRWEVSGRYHGGDRGGDSKETGEFHVTDHVGGTNALTGACP